MATQAAQLTRKELFLRACRGESVPRVPVWMMRQAGRYLPEYREIRAKHAFLKVCKTPKLAVEVSLQPVRTKADVEILRLFDPETETGFLPEVIRRIVREVGRDVPVLGFAAAPWTLACYMVEGRVKEGFAAAK